MTSRLGDAPTINGLIAESTRQRHPTICDDLSDESVAVARRETMLSRGLRSPVALPLITKDRAVGCLVCASDQREAFDAACRPRRLCAKH
jgi:hypothetical protein